MRTTLVLAALALSAPANAENFKIVGAHGDDVIYIDLDEIHKLGNVTIYEMKVVRPDQTYVLEDVEEDCAAHTSRVGLVGYYDASGHFLHSRRANESFPGETMVYALVCG